MLELHKLSIIVLLARLASFSNATLTPGTTGRYWDCCKPSCAFNAVAGDVTGMVNTCDIHDQPLSDATLPSGCGGGSAYMCSDLSPWAISESVAYGFATVSDASPSCCSCYMLTFTSGPIVGKQMVVQAVNINSNVSPNQFAIAVPGGGYGLNDGCSMQWGANSTVWGAQYGGITSNTCDQFPGNLQAGCNFRWEFMQGADNPNVDYFEVTCPAALVAKTGCTPACCIPGGPSAVPTFPISPAASGAPPAPAAPDVPPAPAAPNGPPAPAAPAVPAGQTSLPPEPQGVFITSAGYYSFQAAPVRRTATPIASLAAANGAPLR